MAVYKVPQDVEAEDKLLGPFSFRQFIYLIIAVVALAIAYWLAKMFAPLALIPLPVIIFFGALALPLKKDQPMETYLAALVSFYLKPRKRVWQADGVQSLIEIVEPKIVEEHRTKDITQDEAERRLSYLANLVDSRGWAVRGVDAQQTASAMLPDAYNEAQQASDILDDDSKVAHNFDTMIDQANIKRRQEAVALMNQPPTLPPIPAIPDPYSNLPTPGTQFEATPIEVNGRLTFNPYPEAMRQAVIHPSSPTSPKPQAAPNQAQPAQPQPQAQPAVQSTQPQSSAPSEETPTTSQPIVSPDIMDLVNSSGLSVETIENRAKKIRKKLEASDGEVVISLR